MNKDNIIRQGNWWAVSLLYGWVTKWAATAIYALCLRMSQRRGEKETSWGKRNYYRYCTEVITWGNGEKGEERQQVYCLYPRKPVCIILRSVGDNVSSFPFCHIFTVSRTVSLCPLQGEQKTSWEKRWLRSTNSSGKIGSNNRKTCQIWAATIA